MSEWPPFVTDAAEQARVSRVIREIIAELDAWPDDANLADRALVRMYLAPDDERTGELLARAVASMARLGSLGLHGGATGIGWIVAHASDGADADRVCASIDAALLRRMADPAALDYDLVNGLVGFGVYALERGDAGRPLAEAVLDALDRRARPRGAGVAWLTEPALLPAWQRESSPGGYWNVGVAHGSAGVIALLARFAANAIAPVRTRRLLDDAVACLLAAEPAMASPRYPTWYSEPDGDAPEARLAWCYGDLGISLALVAAARATDNATWSTAAITLAHGCAGRSPSEGHVHDGGVCHGAAGAMHLFHRLYRATGDSIFAAATRRWLDHTLALRTAEPIGGFPAFCEHPTQPGTWRADASLLTGAAGVALALGAVTSTIEPRWDRMLAIDV